MIDTIILHGRGTTESLKVGGKLPGQGSSLRFKMTEALLKDCTESEFINDARERCHPINGSQSCCSVVEVHLKFNCLLAEICTHYVSNWPAGLFF